MTEFINLYPLLVNNVFGGLLLAGIGITIGIIIIGMFSRMSQLLIACLGFAFILAYAIGYVGALVAIPAFIASAMYFVFSLYDLIQRMRWLKKSLFKYIKNFKKYAKMPIKLKRIFEREYKKKGYTKKQADNIFYGYEANLGKKRKWMKKF